MTTNAKHTPPDFGDMDMEVRDVGKDFVTQAVTAETYEAYDRAIEQYEAAIGAFATVRDMMESRRIEMVSRIRSVATKARAEGDEVVSKQDGGPAFPRLGEGFGNDDYEVPGMSLRDYFAGQALTGYLAMYADSKLHDPIKSKDHVVECAYEIADAMLAEREK